MEQISRGAPMLDTMDIKILTILQQDSTLPVAENGKKVGLSTAHSEAGTGWRYRAARGAS
jgi:hypothetical protein